MPFGPLLAALEGIHDPRRPQGQRYNLSHLLLFSALAVLAGATSYQKIITFIAVQRDRLNAAFGAGLRRAPAVNTLRRLFLTLDQDDLEGAFRRHARELNGTVQVTGKGTIALDGKTLRGSFDHLNDRKAAHVLSAFASDAALILAHLEVAGSPGEIAAVPTLITELGLTGVLFTADALHCQKDAFTRAAETGNALLVQVKRNQPTLYDRLAGLCAEHRPFDSHETVDRRRHGRQEHRPLHRLHSRLVALAPAPSGRRQSLPLETTDRQTPDLPANSTVVLIHVNSHADIQPFVLLEVAEKRSGAVDPDIHPLHRLSLRHAREEPG